MPWVAFTVWCTPVGQGYLLIRLSFHVYSPGLLDPLSSLECVSQRTGWSTDHGTFDTGLPPLGEGCDPHQLLEENPSPIHALVNSSYRDRGWGLGRGKKGLR